MATEKQGTGQQSKLTELKDKLQGQLDDTGKRLDQMKQELQLTRAEDQQALADRREQMRERVEQQKSRLKELRDRITEWEREKAAHTKETIASWRQRREVEKLCKRADRAEDFAVEALNIAAMDAEVAEEAALDAISARLDCVNAAAATSS